MATGSVKSALQPSSLASRDTKAAINLTSPVPVPGTQLIIEILSLPEAKPQRTANIASKAIDALSEEVTRTRLASSFEFDIQTNSGILVAIGVVDSGIQAQAIAPTVATRDMTASNNLTAQLPSFPVPGTSLHLEVDFAMQHSKAPTPKIAELIAHFIADLDEWGRAEMKLPEGIIEGDFELRIRPNPGPLGFPDASKIMAELRRIVLDTPIKITFHFNVYNAAGEPVATGNLAVNEGASGKQVANVMTSRDTEPGQELAAPKSDMITARDTAPPPGLAAGNISTPVPVPGNSLNVAVTIPPDAEPLDPTRMSQLLGGLIAHLTHLAQSGTQDMTAPEIWVKGDIQPIWFNEAMGVMQVVKGMVDQGVVRMNFEFVVNIEGFADVVAKGELDVGRGGGGDGGGVGLVAGTESSGAVVPVATTPLAEEGVAMREVWTVVGKKLGVPVESKSMEDATEAMGFWANIIALDNATSSEKTQKELGWHLKQLEQLADLEENYFK
ncbi:uncharacterized protein KY384_001727 [Bacidia gigantensis]|uniref:uncharacterized protein n=1 Tax=Bacidia gigantensis TaxID=2732470 RepID=UPI001D03CD6B|nr:uncharacterized protein KY384_001727 [Bacidia gigantensis]KAG8533984.1 hypothetical protein KY384_001727 [Bacidia gigantensis]